MTTHTAVFNEAVADLRALKGYNDLDWEESYGIQPQAQPGWKKAERRLLVVIESVDSADIRNGRLLSQPPVGKYGNVGTNPMTAVLSVVLQHGWNFAQEYADLLPDEIPALAIANFNACKFYHLEGAKYQHALKKCTDRTNAIIERLNPTDVLVLGDNAAHYLLKKSRFGAHLPFMRGVPHECEVAGKERLVTCSLDLETLYRTSKEDDTESDSALADLLYYTAHHCKNALLGQHPHSLAHLKFKKYKLIQTIEEFDEFYEKLEAFPKDQPIGFDVESAGLEAYHNAFLTQQYAFTTKTAYIVPLWHKSTFGPVFSREDVEYMVAKLRRIWASRKPRLFVGVNVQFDAKLVRAQWDIPFIHHSLWDIPAGEQLLDENLAMFNSTRWRVGEEFIKTPQGNLAAILCAYGNDFYKTAAFSKAERMMFGRVDLPTHEDACRYSAADACSALAMFHAQHDRAARIRIGKNHTYDEWFHNHVVHQMSNTVHATSHMHQCGSHLDVDYLRGLLLPGSVLYKFKDEADAKLRGMETVKAVTHLLAAKAGIGKGGGLFGNAGSALKNLFSLSKPDHKRMLFFEVMKLDPVGKTDGGLDAVDKKFFEAYRNHWDEVQLAEDVSKAAKLIGTFVKGWLEKLEESLDGVKDGCLRPSFGFFDIVTGRLNSFKPNLQQVPSRGALAKHLKRAFVAMRGGLLLAYDYSANEVRFAAIMAGDENYAEVFRVGQRLRQELIQEDDPEKIKALQADIGTKGDVHIQAVFRFLGKIVDKSAPERAAVKGIIFGLIYGKAVPTLGEDMRKDAVSARTKSILALENKIKALNKELSNL